MKINIALLTVTDTRTIDNDKSGGILVTKIAPDLSLSKVLVSVTVNNAMLTFIKIF